MSIFTSRLVLIKTSPLSLMQVTNCTRNIQSALSKEGSACFCRWINHITLQNLKQSFPLANDTCIKQSFFFGHWQGIAFGFLNLKSQYFKTIQILNQQIICGVRNQAIYYLEPDALSCDFLLTGVRCWSANSSEITDQLIQADRSVMIVARWDGNFTNDRKFRCKHRVEDRKMFRLIDPSCNFSMVSSFRDGLQTIHQECTIFVWSRQINQKFPPSIRVHHVL